MKKLTKKQIILDTVNGIDINILYDEIDHKCVTGLSDTFDYLEEQEKKFFKNADEFEKLVIEELEKQNFDIEYYPNGYEDGTIIVRRVDIDNSEDFDD